MKALVIIMIFLLIGAFFIVSNNNLHLSNKEEFNQFGEKYYDWFGKIFGNAKTVTGYVTNMDWLP